MAGIDFHLAGCEDGGWDIDPTYPTGKLVFGSGYTLPNPAVRHIEQGFFELLVASYKGDNAETVRAFVPMARREKNRTANIPLAMNFWWDSTGAKFTDPMEGWITNWNELQAQAAATVSGTTGLQTLTFTPYTGADPLIIQAQVAPPTLGEAAQGKGVMCGLVVEIPDVANHITYGS
ncbi:MAG: hypothetical protein ACOYOQ_00335 [Microthrixaceae bacterium]